MKANGNLSYGYVFEEGYEFPWDDDKYNGDIDDWWEDVRGFRGTIEYPFDEFGEYKPGINSGSPEVSKYISERQEWFKANPCPVELVNYCSRDYPAYILASKSLSSSYDESERVPDGFFNDNEDAHTILLNFFKEYGIVPEPGAVAGWWLSSYTT